jgi:hypothetical protein
MFSIYYGILFFILSSTTYKKKISLKFLLSAFFSNKTMLSEHLVVRVRSCLEYLVMFLLSARI